MGKLWDKIDFSEKTPSHGKTVGWDGTDKRHKKITISHGTWEWDEII